jgi:hypothetical protein
LTKYRTQEEEGQAEGEQAGFLRGHFPAPSSFGWLIFELKAFLGLFSENNLQKGSFLFIKVLTCSFCFMDEKNTSSEVKSGLPKLLIFEKCASCLSPPKNAREG